MDEAKTKEATKFQRLRSISDIAEAHEDVYNMALTGKLDNKTVDALNTTLKGQTYLLGKLRLDAAKIIVTASVKKINIDKFLPLLG